MAHDDNAYFQRRAEQELELAQRAVDGAVVQAHYALAEAYLEKLYCDDTIFPAADGLLANQNSATAPVLRFASA